MENIDIQGAKNSALPIIAGTLLAKTKYKLYNIPLISDIYIQLNLLKQYNVDIKLEKDYIFIDTTNMKIPDKIIYDTNTRGTYYFIGSTIYNDINLEFVLANGCDIDNNNRKIDIHLELIKMYGKKYEYKNEILKIYGKKNINNFNYKFKIPSIGATINGLFIFSNTDNKIILENYAKDPYIFDVINFLIKIGINITFDENKIIIDGKHNNNNEIISHTIIPDPIEAISYIIYSGINLIDNSISSYTIGPLIIEDLGKCKQVLENIGIELLYSHNNYYYIKKNKLNNFNITTGYFPEIYTDTQPFFCILGLHINESSIINELVWNNRFKYVNQLNKFGYNLKPNNNILEINNSIINNSQDNNIILTDLRAGMALYMFFYNDLDKYNIINKHYIDRGYYNYEKKIQIANNKNNIYCNYNTSILSNINIGGITKYYYEAYSINDFNKIMEFCKFFNEKYKIIGGGNNIYFSNYYDGVIIKNKYIYINEDKDSIEVSSGYLLMDLVKYCSDINIDLSNLAGIPGTVGGALFGNAGAYGMEMKDIVINCIIIRDNNLIKMNNKELEFNYRTSVFKQKYKNDIILAIKMEKKEQVCNINDKINNILLIRNKKFIYNHNLGSIFKNPIINNNKIYAWELLDKLELRNRVIKNLKFSEINPNIIINISNASVDDMNDLLYFIEEIILKKFNIIIEKEIDYIN